MEVRECSFDGGVASAPLVWARKPEEGGGEAFSEVVVAGKGGGEFWMNTTGAASLVKGIRWRRLLEGSWFRRPLKLFRWSSPVRGSLLVFSRFATTWLEEVGRQSTN